MDQKENITITNPSDIIITPNFTNQPKSWFILTTNITKPNSPNLSLFKIEFNKNLSQNNSTITVSIDKEKLLNQLDEFIRFQTTLQDFFRKNPSIRNLIISSIEKKGWNYSKHIPW